MTFKRSWHIGLLVTLAALIGSVALSPPAGATTTAATTTAVEVCGQGTALVKPGSMILTCADEGEQAQDLHWTNWTATKATATGNVTWRECQATFCARSRQYGKATADYTLTDPTRVAGNKVLFTRLEMHVTGTTPQGFQRDLAFDETPTTMATPAFSRTQIHAQGIVAAPSGSLSYGEIEGYWLYAGGPNAQEGSYDQAQIAAGITGAESSFLPGIIQSGVDYCGTGSDRAGWGLWQITCGNSVPQFGTDFQILDPWNNAEEAVYKCDEDVSTGYNCFTPWSTWASGAYTQYLSSTAPDMSITDPGEYEQVNSTPSGTPSSPAADPGSTYGPPMTNAADNLLLNGSFENSADGWDVLQPTSGVTNITRYEVGDGAPAAAQDGSWYLATNTNGSGGAIYQDVTVNASAGTSYVGTAWLSAQSGTATGRLCVWGLGSPGTDNCVAYSVTADGYTEVQVVYDLPSAYSDLRFELYPTPNGGTTDIDTASIG